LAFTFVIFDIRVDFQALGIQIIQTQATSFNSKCKSLSSEISQSSAKAGACLVEVVKCAFQKPHLQPLTTSNFKLFSFKSAKISQEFASFTIVQTGTFKTKSKASFQCIQFVHQDSQSSAFKIFLCLYSERVFKFSSVIK
jgi:hypothetical protein